MVKTVFGSYKTRGKKKRKNIRKSVPRNPRMQAIIMRLRRGTTPKGTLPSPVKSLFSLAGREDRNLGLSGGPVVKLVGSWSAAIMEVSLPLILDSIILRFPVSCRDRKSVV